MRPWSMASLLVLSVLVASSIADYRECYGSITGLQPTGKSSGGVSASEYAVSYNLPNLEKYRTCFDQAADNNCIEASLIAAIASRESAGGATLSNGYGDGGKAWGIMQCDLKKSKLPCKNCGWNSCCHINMMVKEKLIRDINSVAANHPTWSEDQVLQGAVAAYNFGVSNVRSWGGLDVGSTDGDYSNDVIAMAQYLQLLGWN